MVLSATLNVIASDLLSGRFVCVVYVTFILVIAVEMNASHLSEFVVYFPHDKEMCVIPKKNMLMGNSVLTEDETCIAHAAYDGDTYNCVVIMATKDEFV